MLHSLFILFFWGVKHNFIILHTVSKLAQKVKMDVIEILRKVDHGTRSRRLNLGDVLDSRGILTFD